MEPIGQHIERRYDDIRRLAAHRCHKYQLPSHLVDDIVQDVVEILLQKPHLRDYLPGLIRWRAWEYLTDPLRIYEPIA